MNVKVVFKVRMMDLNDLARERQTMRVQKRERERELIFNEREHLRFGKFESY